MRISALLEGKGTVVVTVATDAPVATAVAELGTHGIGALVVSDDGIHIDGIISERDVVRALAAGEGTMLQQPVRSIMTETVVTCGPEDDVEAIMRAMTDRRVRHVPVVEDGELRGIVSIGDVVKSRIDELEKDRKELFEYINAR